ncbi:MAG: hypothetical protein CMJ48_00630 [Planctomycetaceae bacterium]|nr:hypothetical protein [Planctomycetaceae bacterium]
MLRLGCAFLLVIAFGVFGPSYAQQADQEDTPAPQKDAESARPQAVFGSLEKIDLETRVLTVKLRDGKTKEFRIAEEVDFKRLDGRPNELKTLKKGDRVRVEIVPGGDRPIVRKLQARGGSGRPRPQPAREEQPPKDPNATHDEVEPIHVELGPKGVLETIAMNRQGNLLAGVSWADERDDVPEEAADAQEADGEDDQAEADRPAAAADEAKPAEEKEERKPARPTRRKGERERPKGPRTHAIRVLAPDGKLVKTWPLENLAAHSLLPCDDGTTYVAGEGRLARLDDAGKTLVQIDMKDVLEGDYAETPPSGLAVSENYLFAAFGVGWSTRATENIVRFDRNLGTPEVLIEKQFGCCAHVDLDVKDGELLVAENSRHRVNRFSFDGELIERWGKRDRSNIEGFSSCCNPCNFDFGPDDVLYTAESGLGRVKKYSAKGAYLGVVGYVDTTKFLKGSHMASQSCYIPIEVGKDATRIYVMDVRANMIRVLQVKADQG